MGTFYLHLHNDIDAPDAEGIELRDPAAARAYAEESARFTIAETIKDQSTINFNHHIDIDDGRGNVLATVRFGDVVKTEG